MTSLVIANPPRRRKRKWGSPKQRAALKRMLAANPRRHRSPRRRAKVRTNPGGFIVAKRRTRRNSARRSIARRVRTAYRKVRRSGGSRGGGGMLGKYLPPGGLTALAGGVAGFLGTQYALGKLPLPAQLQTGNGRILAKVLIGIVGRMALKRVNAPLANAFATGALTSAGLDVAAKAMGQAGISGYDPGAGTNLSLTPGLGAYDAYGNPGLGAYGDFAAQYAN